MQIRNKTVLTAGMLCLLLGLPATAYAEENDQQQITQAQEVYTQPVTQQDYTQVQEEYTQAPTEAVQTEAPTPEPTQPPTDPPTTVPQTTWQQTTQATTTYPQTEATQWEEETTVTYEQQEITEQVYQQETEATTQKQTKKKEKKTTKEEETTTEKKEEEKSSFPWQAVAVMVCIAALIPITFGVIRIISKRKKANAMAEAARQKRAARRAEEARNAAMSEDGTDSEYGYDATDNINSDSTGTTADAKTTRDILDEDAYDDEYTMDSEDRPNRRAGQGTAAAGAVGAAAFAGAAGASAGEEAGINTLIFDFSMRAFPEVHKGARDLEAAMDVIDGMDEAEIKNVILTPLYQPGKENFDKEDIQDIFDELVDKTKADYGYMKFYLGHRVLYNKMMYKAVRSGKVMTLAGSRYLLVDFPEKTNLIDIEKCVVHLVDLGIRPIISHVETLKDLDEIEECEDLINSGAYLMTDLSSYYGPKASIYKKHMENVFEHELISFIEADSKFVVGMTSKIYKPLDWISQLCSDEYMYKMLVTNPTAIVENEEVDFKMV